MNISEPKHTAEGVVQTFKEIVMKVIILLVVMVVGATIGTFVDSLLGIKMSETFGELPAIVHNVIMMLYGMALSVAMRATT